jgi:nucleotide-binding universal stress UspA family protein
LPSSTPRGAHHAGLVLLRAASLQLGAAAAVAFERMALRTGWAERIEGGTGPVISCIDGSDGSRSAARVAALLHDRLGLRLILLSVASKVMQPGVSAVPHGPERLAEEERRVAEELLRDVAADIGATDAELRVEYGAAADRVLEVCEAEGAAFVVLGSRGRGRMKAAVLGSVSHDVAARASCPVIIVPAR